MGIIPIPPQVQIGKLEDGRDVIRVDVSRSSLSETNALLEEARRVAKYAFSRPKCEYCGTEVTRPGPCKNCGAEVDWKIPPPPELPPINFEGGPDVTMMTLYILSSFATICGVAYIVGRIAGWW